jgi:hypothetical protein
MIFLDITYVGFSGISEIKEQASMAEDSEEFNG